MQATRATLVLLPSQSRGGLDRFYRLDSLENTAGKPATAKIFSQLKSGYEALKKSIFSAGALDNKTFACIKCS
jgi:hypothetical protein